MKLKLNEISKSFGPVKANSDINLTVDRGEILGLLGENGAGKTTLMNILTGLYKPDSGSILIDNQLKVFHNPREANKNGVGMVHQHFMLVPVFSVTENIILGTEPTTIFNKIDLTNAKEKVLKISSEYNLDVNPDQLIEKLEVHPEDVESRSMGAGGEDLIMARAAREKFPYSVECKNQEKLNIWESYSQAVENSKDYEPVVVIKRNNHKPHLS